MLIAWLGMSLAVANAASQDSVAVMPLVPLTGVDAGTATLVTDAFLVEVRGSRRFSRVVSSADLETVLGMERQKQLMDCNSSSCLTELAGALGVTHVCAGSVGKLGGVYQLSLKLIDARTGQLLGAVTRQAGGTVDVVAKEMPGAVRALLAQDARAARVDGHDAPPAPAQARPPWGWRIGAAVGVGLALVGAVALSASLVLAAATAVLPFVVYLPLPSSSYTARFVITRAPIVGGLVGALAFLVAAIVGAGLGVFSGVQLVMARSDA